MQVTLDELAAGIDWRAFDFFRTQIAIGIGATVLSVLPQDDMRVAVYAAASPNAVLLRPKISGAAGAEGLLVAGVANASLSLRLSLDVDGPFCGVAYDAVAVAGAATLTLYTASVTFADRLKTAGRVRTPGTWPRPPRILHSPGPRLSQILARYMTRGRL